MTGARNRLTRYRALAVGALTVGLSAGALALAGPASAHNVLERTDPGNGARLGALPGQVVLTFDQPALKIGSQIKIVGPGGDVSDGGPVLVDQTVAERVKPGSPAGSYTVQWRVTSADGHPISGSFAFTAAAGSPGSAAAPAGSTTSSGPQKSSSSGATTLVLLIVIAAIVLIALGLLSGWLGHRRRAGDSD